MYYSWVSFLSLVHLSFFFEKKFLNDVNKNSMVAYSRTSCEKEILMIMSHVMAMAIKARFRPCISISLKRWLSLSCSKFLEIYGGYHKQYKNEPYL